jgi:16S rRNA (cytosine1402-N4)-methyltransferase
MIAPGYHDPVLEDVATGYLITDISGIYVDCTLGGSGHTLKILKTLSPTGRLVGIDMDEDALEHAKIRLKDYTDRIILIRGNFGDLEMLLNQHGIKKVNGIMADLGLSSHQIDSEARGFSYQSSGPLDMRMDRGSDLRAEEIINTYSEDALYDIFKRYGEERYSRNIARRIIKERDQGAIKTTSQLADIISAVVPYKQEIKSKSRIFQSLRVYLNSEMRNLERLLEQSLHVIRKNGRLVTIAYQSQEDSRIKQFMKYQEKSCVCPPDFPVCVCDKQSTLKILTRRAIVPTEEEIQRNSRSKSARLRAAEIIQ